MNAQRREAGITAVGSSEKKATPLGRLKTPAPTILLARLNVDVDIKALPPLLGAFAVITILLFDLEEEGFFSLKMEPIGLL